MKNKHGSNDDHQQSNDTKIAVLENTNTFIIQALNDIKAQLKSMDSKFESKFDRLENRMWTNFTWLLSTIILFSLGLCGVMAKGFHWFG